MEIDKVIDRMSETRLAILRELNKNSFNLSRLSDRTGIGISTVSRSIDGLVDLRLVTRDGNKVYHINSRGKEIVEAINRLGRLLPNSERKTGDKPE